MKRCKWVNLKEKIYIDYHDHEWGIPSHDDSYLFEMLLLESFQAGLSWLTILKKRENFRKAFDNFEISKISKYNENKINELLNNKEIIRNKTKIKAAINNSKIFINLQKKFGTFDKYILSFTNNKIIKNNLLIIPSTTALSDIISKYLINRGMKFVGSTIINSYLEAIGIINNYDITCYKYKK